MIEKAYIGDGVYADFDGYHVVLTTENGIEVTNQIALEPEVIVSLINYFKSLADAIADYNEQMTIKAAAGKTP